MTSSANVWPTPMQREESYDLPSIGSLTQDQDNSLSGYKGYTAVQPGIAESIEDTEMHDPELKKALERSWQEQNDIDMAIRKSLGDPGFRSPNPGENALDDDDDPQMRQAKELSLLDNRTPHPTDNDDMYDDEPVVDILLSDTPSPTERDIERHGSPPKRRRLNSGELPGERGG